MEAINCNVFKSFLLNLARQALQVKEELNSMDAACGDGDFGSTMAYAFEEAMKKLEEVSSNDVGLLLTLTGTTIMSSAGGTSGPTVATIFLEAGKAAKGKSEVNLQDLALMFEKADQQVRALGGAANGDKTLIDSLDPAVNALKEAVHGRDTIPNGLERVALAASAGCESTKRMIAKHGRARYLGEQTLGHIDPGAYLVSLIFSNLAESTQS